MAAPTSVTAAIAIADSTVITLSGPTKFVVDLSGANAIQSGDVIRIYELAVSGDYQPVKISQQHVAALTYYEPSIIVEGYGDYKLLASVAGIGVGYVSA
jgi:hypothetical protein